ncbi:VOC family protein [Pigmentiphaga sp.]|uniref:VOC family protein n=1 Tax=Pigmentiphaga sp. TaxID=1977564 RepID=UPI00128C0394|nr:VOC family protein [Pigmentiphaga sp.]
MLQSLGYVGLGTSRLAEWEDFAQRLLGMQVADRSRHTLALRMDDRRQRLLLDADAAQPHFFGWEVADGGALATLAARLDRANVPFVREPDAVARRREVAELLSLSDPAGNRLEVFHGAAQGSEPFRPGRAISGFRTGPLGLGHVVLNARNVDALAPFYRDLLGFRLSDYMREPFKAFFFHLNSRHHSLALIEADTDGIHHLMVELCSLDDVGQGYDIASCEADRVAVTLGRHINDFMTSFYVRTPSPLMIEYGWGGRSVGRDWQPCELMHGASLWGHDRQWLPADKRALALDLRLAAAAQGQRAPVQVLPGNHQLAADGMR